MITLVSTSTKPKIPTADYTLDKTDKFYEILSILTPKFSGKWLFVLLDPKIVFVKDLVNDHLVPDWVDVQIFTGDKKINEICLEFPAMQPKSRTKKEAFEEVLTSLTHLVDNKAREYLFEAFKNNPTETEEVLQKIDKSFDGVSIPLKTVQSNLIVNKHVYASQVLEAFISHDKKRWNLYTTLVKEIGQEVAYYAMYKHAKKLLQEKNKFLQNEDVKLLSVKDIDAPAIAYAFILFSNSKNYLQLPVILNALENRSQESLSMLQNNNL